MKRDGHIHTAYCPHGSKDTLIEYIEKAITLGYKELSFTEHSPLPLGFSDAAPTKDSAMDISTILSYIEEVKEVKAAYKNQIKINVGLEVDYVEGYEKETTAFLNKYGPFLDDSILSVHFLKNEDHYDCMDYSPDVFKHMIKNYGNIKNVYDRYYETVRKSIYADLGPYKPRRIGHITLVHKFQKKFPIAHKDDENIREVLYAIKDQNYELDYNGAGLFKPLCKETYPPLWVIKEANTLNIPLVYGSDAHQIKELGQGYDRML